MEQQFHARVRCGMFDYVLDAFPINVPEIMYVGCHVVEVVQFKMFHVQYKPILREVICAVYSTHVQPIDVLQLSTVEVVQSQ